MTDRTDYKKPRHNILDIIPQRFHTDVNVSVMETSFNRFLTKTELAKVVGTIGRTTSGARTNQLPESTPHEQAFQLQPQIVKSIGTEDYITSFKDILRELERLGVSSQRLPKWLSTQRFNFAPPIDFDKFLNFSDYYWFDESDQQSIPQYITIKNPCTVAKALFSQKQREVSQLGDLNIIEMDYVNNAVLLTGNLVSAIPAGMTVDIEGSTANDGQYTAVSSELIGTTTVVTLEQPLVVDSTFGQLTFTTFLFELRRDVECFCNQSAGWDTTAWDDVDNGVLWDSLSQCQPQSPSAQAWTNDNYWFHRRDLTTVQISKATRATFPIIEYTNTLEFNEWAFAQHVWMYRESLNAQWVETTTQPTESDVFVDRVTLTLNPEFHQKWSYVGVSSVVPVAPPTVNEDVVVLSTNSADPNLFLNTGDYTCYKFPASQQNVVVAGTDSIGVYVDGVRQYGTYLESSMPQTVGTFVYSYVRGITFFEQLPVDSFVTIELTPPADVDQWKNVIPVRTSTDDTFSVVPINGSLFKKTEQVKRPGEHQYPLFNLYNLDGSDAHIASPIFSFKHDQTAPFNTQTGMRIEMNGSVPMFEQHLVDEDDGVMLMYRDYSSVGITDPDGFQTIWRTGQVGGTYTPRFVDSNNRVDGEQYVDNTGTLKIAEVTSTNGDWEVAEQMFYNVQHRNRKVLSFTDLVAHFKSIIEKQSLPFGYFDAPSLATRLLFSPDYSVGGTIKEFNDGFDLLVSSTFINNTNPISVLAFADQQYSDQLNTIKEIVRKGSVNYLLNTSNEFMDDLVGQIIADVISKFELNDFLNKVYGDSGSYDATTDTGIRNWIATLAMLRLVNKTAPVLIEDEKNGIFELRHHDGHLSTFTFMQSTIKDINAAVVNAPISSNRKRGWTATASADGQGNVATYQDIPFTRLLKNDYWLSSDGLSLYRFGAVAIQPSSPSIIEYSVGAYWLRSTDGQLFQLQQIMMGVEWVPISAPGDHSAAWQVVDLNAIIRDTLLEVEERLYAVSPSSDVVWSEQDYILDQQDQELFDQMIESSFYEFTKTRNIPDPYIRDYDPQNPFTWNYSDVEVSSPSIQFPVVKDVSKWAARWHTIYENIFNTPYPHREPWRLQGYISKPDWWDEEYRDVNLVRVWTSVMWDNIKNAVIPTGREAPPTPPPFYSFVCVNTTDVTTTDGYGPDDLLPPYWVPSTALPQDAALINEVFIRDSQFITSADMTKKYQFGDQGPVEWMWRKSSSYLYSKLAASFKLQPMRFLFKTWGINLVYRGGLNIDADAGRVFSTRNTTFHGDIVDNTIFTSSGINQWFVQQIRYRDGDLLGSDFRPMWTEWTPQMSYEFNGFIDPRSLRLSTQRAKFDKHDYKIATKHTRGYTDAFFDSLQISVANRGEYITRRDTKIPSGGGENWVFTVTTSNPVNVPYEVYGVYNYSVESVDINTNTLLLDAPTSLQTGDQIQVTTSGTLPSPLQPGRDYYVIKTSSNTIQLADTNPTAGLPLPISLNDFGSGIMSVFIQTNTFFAQGGSATAHAWRHNKIDKSKVIAIQFPLLVTGVQSLIDLIDGYAEMQRDVGFIFNDSEAREIDPDTGRLIGWQTETERMITSIYSGLGLESIPARYKGALYSFSVDPIADVLTIDSPVEIVYEEGQEVFMFTNGSLPMGLLLNTAYYTIPLGNNRFKLATSYKNALDGLHVDFTTFGFGGLLIGTLDPESVMLNRSVEVNPFRNNIWYNTTRGILANVLTGPFVDFRTDRVVYDQYGRPLDETSLRVYRQDQVSRIMILGDNQNDLVDTTDPYNFIHISGGHLFSDIYQHVLMLNDSTVTGDLIFDSYLGVYLPLYNIEFDRQSERTGRPSVGGFFIHDNKDVIRNIEGQAENLQSFFDAYSQRENTSYTQYSRELLGYTNPDYFDLIGASEKTKFIFWRGLIQQKGSVSAVEAFINSRRFIDARVDEHWAYKVADYGDSRESTTLTLKVKTRDQVNSDVRYHFSTNPERSFVGVSFDDQDRWEDLIDIQQMGIYNAGSLYFNAKDVEHQVDLQSSISSYASVTVPSETITIIDTTTNEDITNRFRQLNANVLEYIDPTPFDGTIRLISSVVAANQHFPIKMVDTTSSATVASLDLWDPARGYHNNRALTCVDVISPSDPVRFIQKSQSSSALWTDSQAGVVWWDTSKLGYLPYYDAAVYPSLTQQLTNWGRLSDWSDVVLYEWTRSSVPPEQFDELASQEENDTSIPPTTRATGIARKCIYFNDSLLDESQLHLEFFVYEGVPLPTALFSSSADVTVYVNGKILERTTFDQISLSNLRPSDRVHVVREVRDAEGELLDSFTEGYDFIRTEEYGPNGVDVVPIYYFWVRQKKVKKAHRPFSLQQAEQELRKPSVPYAIVRKQEQGTSQLPTRFTQLMLRNISQNLNVDDRFVLQIDRDETLRDVNNIVPVNPNHRLDLSSGAPIAKPLFQEWTMFRQNSDTIISNVLWRKLTEAVVGYTMDTYNSATPVSVPSIDRQIFDNQFGTNTRFGLAEGQAFGDQQRLIDTIVFTIASNEFDPAPVDKRDFFDSFNFDSPEEAALFMEFIYNNFPISRVNEVFFNCLHDVLSLKVNYSDIMKTSMVTVYGIKLFDVDGE